MQRPNVDHIVSINFTKTLHEIYRKRYKEVTYGTPDAVLSEINFSAQPCCLNLVYTTK